MKADARHQLKTNELAQALMKLRNMSDERVRYILIGLAVLLAVVIGWRWWRWSAARERDQISQKLLDLDSKVSDPGQLDAGITELRALIQNCPDETLRGYARLVLASALQRKAVGDPAQTQSWVQQAHDEAQAIVSAPQTPPALLAAATYSLATTFESSRDFERARGLYKTLVDDTKFDGSPYKELARRRLDSLERIRTPVEFVPGSPPFNATPTPEAQSSEEPTATPEAPAVPETPAQPVEPVDEPPPAPQDEPSDEPPQP